MRVWWKSVLFGSGIFCLFSAGCVYDPEDVCGPNQQLNQNDLCICSDHSVPAQPSDELGGCTRCQANQIVVGNQCVCAPGWVPDTQSDSCIETAQGRTCSAETGCSDPAFNYCHIDESSDQGYCTSTGCQDHAQCAGDYVCKLQDDPSYCQRPPVGLGVSCSQNNDCEGFEAPYCDLYAGICRVSGCEPKQSASCFEGYVCCDTSALPFSGIPSSLCLAHDETQSVIDLGADCG